VSGNGEVTTPRSLPYTDNMPDRSRKKMPSDINALAAKIVDEATREPAKPKNPHAVALGRKGGKVGGKKRAEKLSPERRRQIAQDAAVARWGKKPG
jgi:hypothetical protein